MEDLRESINELMDTPLDFSVFVMNRLKVDTLTPELLVGPTFELMKGSCKSLVELEYIFEEVYKATTDQLDWNNPEECSVQVPVSYDKHASRKISSGGGENDIIYGFAINGESARDVYSKRRIIAVIMIEIVEWNNYKHLDWFSIRRDDGQAYKFKEEISTLQIQVIEDLLFFFVRQVDKNLTLKERLAFNISLRMFTRSVVIQRHVEDLSASVKELTKEASSHKSRYVRSRNVK
ncbi:hypothetical protein Tco_0680851 [Tanacetum coccineum]|uniref:Uncharacterized protein n=1 Tax=Tanacetum coccineum TaxID=301880 RepID=A0ABQ4XLQ5_9ASTR